MPENPFEAPENDGPESAVAATARKSPIVGFVIVIVAALILIFGILVLPIFRRNPELVHRTQCRNNLKKIARALNDYEQEHGSLPPAYTVDAEGRPLHSWRTLILPHLDQKALFDSIDLTKPWDDPINADALKTDLQVYRCPSARRQIPIGNTTYLAVVGENSGFNPINGRTRNEITDDSGETLLLIDVPGERAVPWMAPSDVDADMLADLSKDTNLQHVGGFQAIMADYSAQFLPVNLPEEDWHSLSTINGGDTPKQFE